MAFVRINSTKIFESKGENKALAVKTPDGFTAKLAGRVKVGTDEELYRLAEGQMGVRVSLKMETESGRKLTASAEYSGTDLAEVLSGLREEPEEKPAPRKGRGRMDGAEALPAPGSNGASS